MKILGVRLARSIWLVPQHFFNPRGIFLRRASEEIKRRYSFFKSPYDNGTAGTAEAKYEAGGFKTPAGPEIKIDTIVLHSDGLVVDSQSSTEETDAFIEDIFTWLGKEHGLPPVSEVPLKKLYQSELNIALDKKPRFFNPALEPFMKAVSTALDDGNTGPAGFLGFQLITDPERSSRPAQFRFEREVNTALDANRYYSFAPIQTALHVQLLRRLEEVL